ncbi:MAG: MraY family glycosyltransferase [Luteimonas sp.]
MSKLQGVGDDQAVAQLCSGLSVADSGGAFLGGWVATHIAIAAGGTWLARRYALQHQLLDQPGVRRSHQTPTPRGGGIGIVASLLFALEFLAWRHPAHASLLGATALGSAMVAGVGWLDDHRPLSPWSRLVVQCIAALLLAWGLRQEGAASMTLVVAFVGAMALVNIWNFMDGIDGLAASQALIAAAAYGLMTGNELIGWLAFALSAACLGFLPFNLPRARIFLGDVGSGTIGYAVAALAAWMMMLDRLHAPVLMLPVSAFCIDATLTLAARIARGDRWWLPHTEHAYQYWARRSGHGPVTLAFACWTLLASAVMLAAKAAPPAFIIGLLFVFGLTGVGAWMSLRRIPQSQEDTNG